MKRKIISLLLMVVLCLNLAMSVSAAHYSFVVDFLDVLSDNEVETLDEMAVQLYEDTGIGVFFVYDIAPDLQGYNYTAFTAELTDYYIMVENEDSWYYFAGGKGEQLDTDALREAYDNTETYVEGVEAYLAEASLQLTLLDDGTEDGQTTEENLLVWDEAELLSQAEVGELNSKLETISKKYNAEIHVVTISSMDGGDIDEFLEFLYDEYGFGYGENHDGVLLLVCMDPREWRILSNGFAGEAITSSDIDSIGDTFVSDLTDGNYPDAFDTFADECEYYLDGYINGFPFNFGFNLVVALVVGFVIALIVTGIWKGQLKSVHMQGEANVYLRPGSMQISQSGEHFLYSSISKSRRHDDDDDRSSDSGGGSRSIGGGSF